MFSALVNMSLNNNLNFKVRVSCEIPNITYQSLVSVRRGAEVNTGNVSA